MCCPQPQIWDPKRIFQEWMFSCKHSDTMKVLIMGKNKFRSPDLNWNGAFDLLVYSNHLVPTSWLFQYLGCFVGQELVNGVCKCPDGQILDNRVCACGGEGQILVNSTCICPGAQKNINNTCTYEKGERLNLIIYWDKKSFANLVNKSYFFSFSILI